jgi:hypothetical protein
MLNVFIFANTLYNFQTNVKYRRNKKYPLLYKDEESTANLGWKRKNILTKHLRKDIFVL